MSEAEESSRLATVVASCLLAQIALHFQRHPTPDEISTILKDKRVRGYCFSAADAAVQLSYGRETRDSTRRCVLFLCFNNAFGREHTGLAFSTVAMQADPEFRSGADTCGTEVLAFIRSLGDGETLTTTALANHPTGLYKLLRNDESDPDVRETIALPGFFVEYAKVGHARSVPSEYARGASTGCVVVVVVPVLAVAAWAFA